MRLVNNYIPAPVTDTYNGREIFPSWKTCVQGAAPRHGYFHAPPPLSSLYRCSFLVRVITLGGSGKINPPPFRNTDAYRLTETDFAGKEKNWFEGERGDLCTVERISRRRFRRKIVKSNITDYKLRYKELQCGIIVFEQFFFLFQPIKTCSKKSRDSFIIKKKNQSD